MTRRLLPILLLVARTASAQVAVPPVNVDSAKLAAAPSDTVAVMFERPNGSLLRPGSVTYELSSSRAGQLASLGVRTVQVAESTLAGTPVWLLTESRTGSVVETTDSLYLTRAELMPLRWSATSGRAMVAASFSHDTAFGALQGYQGRSSFTVAMGPGALVTPGMVERLVEMLPLRAGYRALASVLVVEMGAPRALPATIAVEREEALPVGEQPVDCWVVTLRSGATEERLWVTKDMPRVVKTEQAFATGVLTAMVRLPQPAVVRDSTIVPPLVPPAVPPAP